jgi:hypothetical protein
LKLRFGNDQAFARKFPIENFSPGFLIQGPLDLGFLTFSTKKSYAPTAAGAADFRRFSAVS